MSDLFRLSEAQVDRLRPFFPKSRGKPRIDDRRVLSGLIFIQRNGLMWKYAPAAYGPPKTFYNRSKRWSRIGVFATIMAKEHIELGGSCRTQVPSCARSWAAPASWSNKSSALSSKDSAASCLSLRLP